jgi:hypothetical protein
VVSVTLIDYLSIVRVGDMTDHSEISSVSHHNSWLKEIVQGQFWELAASKAESSSTTVPWIPGYRSLKETIITLSYSLS